jgi:hypothetical protein
MKSIALYAVYLALHIAFPGVLALNVVLRRRVSTLEALALGLPIGFGLEIATYFIVSELGWREALRWTPLTWFALAYLSARRLPQGRSGMGIVRPSAHGFFVFALLSLAFVYTAVGRFYAGTPLQYGGLATATHHDWVYLLSRAAEIREQWPLQDPSMAGQPLSYHYFFLVHIASSSWVTGVGTELIGLRLAVLPLGLILGAQAYYLGAALSGRALGGMLAAGLLMCVGEVSFDFSGGWSPFGSWFLDWLFISPTFFFGMIFTGALIIWVDLLWSEAPANWRHWSILVLLAAVGTGAKGTVVPPLCVGLAICAVFHALRFRCFPQRLFAVGGGLLVGFVPVYFFAMRDWGTGSASLVPFASAKVAGLWTDLESTMRSTLLRFGFEQEMAAALAAPFCFVAVLVGFFGVNILAVWTLRFWREQAQRRLCIWLGAVATGYVVFGQAVHLDSNSQLYLWLPIVFPFCVLTAASLNRLWLWARSLQTAETSYYSRWAGVVLVITIALLTLSWWAAAFVSVAAALFIGPTRRRDVACSLRGAARFAWQFGPVFAVAAVIGLQTYHWARRNLTGYHHFKAAVVAPEDTGMRALRDGMAWVRANTPRDALVVANAFTRDTMQVAQTAAIDRTTVDKYFYYSALSGRRLWVEGPTYLRNQAEASRRIETATKLLHGEPLSEQEYKQLSRWAHLYLVVDNALPESARVSVTSLNCVYSNERIAVYQWKRPELPVSAAATASNLR